MPTSKRTPIQSPVTFWQAVLSRLRARHARHYRDSYFHFWADLLLVSLLVALAIIILRFSFWHPRPAFSVSLLNESTSIESGQVEDYTITYQNNEDTSLSNAEIELKLPSDFEIVSTSVPSQFNAESTTFLIGEIKGNDKGKISFQGLIKGELGKHYSIEVIARARAQGLFRQTLSSLPFTLEKSALELTADIPTTVYAQTPFVGNVELVNTSSKEMNDVIVSFPNTDFDIVPEETKEDGKMWVPVLAAGEKKSISFRAISQTSGNLTLNMESGLTVKGTYLPQVHIARVVSVSEPSLIVTSQFSTAVEAINPEADMTINFKNSEGEALENVELSVVSSRSEVLVKDIIVSSDSTTVSDTVIKIGTLQPQAQGVITGKIKLERKAINSNDATRLNTLISYTKKGEKFSYTLAGQTVKFNSNVSLIAGGYYYGPQGDQLGVGPIPPQVDIPTTYWIIWQINNLGNDLEGINVTADLPANVAWSEQQSVNNGSVQYSPVSRRVRWEAGAVAKGGGTYRASFAVTLVPQVADIGSTPVLLKNIKLEGRDVFSGSQLEKKNPDITTNLEKDPLTVGKGEVVPTE